MKQSISKSHTKVLVNCLISLMIITSTAVAQTRPAVHWTTFDKQASQCACHLFARSALKDEGLTEIFEDTKSIILAGNKSVIAEIVCLPNNRQIRLSAFSSDNDLAAKVRNNLRTNIVKARLFDTCP
jgi:hypothetical protein